MNKYQSMCYAVFVHKWCIIFSLDDFLTDKYTQFNSPLSLLNSHTKTDLAKHHGPPPGEDSEAPEEIPMAETEKTPLNVTNSLSYQTHLDDKEDHQVEVFAPVEQEKRQPKLTKHWFDFILHVHYDISLSMNLY